LDFAPVFPGNRRDGAFILGILPPFPSILLNHGLSQKFPPNLCGEKSWRQNLGSKRVRAGRKLFLLKRHLLIFVTISAGDVKGNMKKFEEVLSGSTEMGICCQKFS
jgi:hypothetical protein